MKPYQMFRHTVAIALDCEKILCGRCNFLCDSGDYCELFRCETARTKLGHPRRLAVCKLREVPKP